MCLNGQERDIDVVASEVDALESQDFRVVTVSWIRVLFRVCSDVYRSCNIKIVEKQRFCDGNI
jgi:hypothetical protein